ncbi:MAG: GAF domain-containing protein [Nitrospinae bacterium]|nr:GAF domain-containing protein [Nitrospinota bacterium]
MEREASALQEIARVISDGRDLNEILHGLIEVVPRAMEIPRCMIFRVGRECGELVMPASIGLSAGAARSIERRKQPLDALTPIQREVLMEGRTVAVEDVAADPHLHPEDREYLGFLGMRSILGVPLRMGGKSIGYFTLDDPHRPRAFSEGEIRLAEVIAAHAALAIDRAEAWEEAQKASGELEWLKHAFDARVEKCTGAWSTVQNQRVRDLAALVEAGIAITSELSLDKVLQRIVDVARGVLRAHYAALGVVAEGDAQLERFFVSGIDAETQAQIGLLPVGRGILGALLREGKPLRLRDLTKDPRSVGFPPHHPPMRSFLGVPIISRGRVFGRLYFTEKQDEDEFSEEDESLALSLAAQAAVAIENARLFQETQEQQERLLRAERLSAIGTLAATVSHELRNPLSVINNAVFFLSTKVPRDDPRVVRNLEIIRREVQTATHVIEDLLDFARSRPLHVTPVEAELLVRDTLIRQQMPVNMHVENLVPKELPPLCVDPGQMQQVLSNLIENAMQAMPDGGTLRLEGAAGGGRATLRVSDTGVGIAPENLSRIFEPLFTTRSRGVGLGLALVRRMVEAHGGHVSVESEVGKGTTFILELPTAEADRKPISSGA